MVHLLLLINPSRWATLQQRLERASAPGARRVPEQVVQNQPVFGCTVAERPRASGPTEFLRDSVGSSLGQRRSMNALFVKELTAANPPAARLSAPRGGRGASGRRRRGGRPPA